MAYHFEWSWVIIIIVIIVSLKLINATNTMNENKTKCKWRNGNVENVNVVDWNNQYEWPSMSDLARKHRAASLQQLSFLCNFCAEGLQLYVNLYWRRIEYWVRKNSRPQQWENGGPSADGPPRGTTQSLHTRRALKRANPPVVSTVASREVCTVSWLIINLLFFFSYACHLP